MDKERIAALIKAKRKEKGLTQAELAEEIHVTEKAVSRWETGRGTPDISLLLPLSEALGIQVEELLNGEESPVQEIITYEEEKRKELTGKTMRKALLSFVLSLLIFLIYLRYEYDPSVELNYLLRLALTVIASVFVLYGNHILEEEWLEKEEDRALLKKISLSLVFAYYAVLMFNMTLFARYHHGTGLNLIPFRTILTILTSGNKYSIFINILGNFIIYMPLSFFLMELFHVKDFKRHTLVSLLIIVITEVLQYVTRSGVADIDDVILCTLGMIIFRLLYLKHRAA